MKIGYVRTSEKDQNPDLQRRDLLAAGCEKICEEQVSSRKEDRPELRAAMDYCLGGDELVVWKLDCFGRSLRELIDLVNALRERGVEFVSLRESIHTTTPGGTLVFHVFGAVAEIERDLILERTVAGLEAAREHGRKGGRKPAMDERKIASASRLMRDRETPISEVCEAVGVSQATLYTYVSPTGIPGTEAPDLRLSRLSLWASPVRSATCRARWFQKRRRSAGVARGHA